MRRGKVQYFRGADNLWHFHVRAANGQITAQGQGYQDLRSARKGVTSTLLTLVSGKREVQDNGIS